MQKVVNFYRQIPVVFKAAVWKDGGRQNADPLYSVLKGWEALVLHNMKDVYKDMQENRKSR